MNKSLICGRLICSLTFSAICFTSVAVAGPLVAESETALFADDLPSDESARDFATDIESALVQAGANRAELTKALDVLKGEERESLLFLIRYMPSGDLQRLTSDFLIEHVQLAHRVMTEVSWGAQIPRDVFLNDVLPYANTTEKREPWRRRLYDRFIGKAKQAKSPGEAAAILNSIVFPELQVRYSTKRQRADQSPSQSMESGLASCSGLSILLIDACRSVGVPARFVGTPLWADESGNHSWVEVWDDGWHFTGAAEPNGTLLDAAWFTGRASQALAEDPMKAIYAVSYRKTPIHFPLVWAPSKTDVYAVNVTDRYTRVRRVTPEGQVLLRIRATNGQTNERMSIPFQILDAAQQPLASGQTKDERFDSNDHTEVIVPKQASLVLRAGQPEQALVDVPLLDVQEGQLIDIRIP